MFEIKEKDGRGRTGFLTTKHGKIKTPALMPVIHPGKQTIDVKELGAEIVITNAYIIYKSEELTEIASKEGVHKLIDFDGPIMTDSGSFQLSLYGDIDVSNKEIIEFQKTIASDIGTSLDIPTAPYVRYEKAKRDLDITLERAKEAERVKGDFILNSVVQGSTFADLRSYCADELSKLDFELHPIGAVVPLMESYKYKDLVDVVMNSVMHLPESRPRHLMGAGHPMIFSLAVLMGCDLFDSAAYILYAEDDRFLTVSGTLKLENLEEMPCSCEICNKYTPDDLRKMDKKERSKLIAKHNLYISLAEIRIIRQAISDGNLIELVEQRCRAHPKLLEAYRRLSLYNNNLEKFDPLFKKSAFFYTGSESLKRPEVARHLKKLEKTNKKRDLIILPPRRKPYSKYFNESLGDFYVYGSELELDLNDTDFMVLDYPFGLIPLNLDEVYPLSQNDSPNILDNDSLEFLENIMANYVDDYKQVLINGELIEKLNLGLFNIHPQSDEIKIKISDEERVRAVANYQFGNDISNELFKGQLKIVKSKKTGKIRHIYDKKNLLVNMRASDSYLVLSKEGAIRLHKASTYPKNRVVVNEESESFAREGKSVFAKFVIDADEDIKSQQEVLIVNKNDELLAFGKTLKNYKEIMDFNSGQAIKTRKGFKIK